MVGEMSTIFFSVIIPTFNRNELLAQCLDQLKPEIQLFDKELYEVIVTDDSEESKAKKLIENDYLWVRWVEGPRKGPAANRNNGANSANGDWLVFLDDDCIPDFDLLASYKARIEQRPAVSVFEGRIYTDRPMQRLDEEAPVNETGGYLWSCNFCIKRTLFNRINGFDESFPYAAMEDVDLRKRLNDAGYDIAFVRSASVLHPWREISDKKIFKKRILSHEFYFNKHPDERAKFNLRFVLSTINNELRASIKIMLAGHIEGVTIVPLRIWFAWRLYKLANFRKKNNLKL